MRNILITLKKELRSIFRAKKTLYAMFIYPILIPAMVFLYGSIGEIEEPTAANVDVGFNYKLNQEERNLLKSLNINYKEYNTEEDLESAYKDKEIQAYIIKKENTYYKAYLDLSSTDGLTTASFLEEYFDSYNKMLSANYIANAGLNPEEAFNQIGYELESLESNNYMVTIVLAVSLTYTILAICISSSNMAIQSTATEKENGTLETIMTFPIKKGELITGKYAASVIVGFISAIVSFILMVLSIFFCSKTYSIYDGVKLNLSITSIIGSILVCLMASVFIAGICMFLTSFAKSYKEAQSKISFITMIGIIPLFVSILEVKITKLYYLIPICNFQQLLQEFLLSKVNLVNFLIVIASTITYTYIIIRLIIKLYNGEKILYNN